MAFAQRCLLRAPQRTACQRRGLRVRAEASDVKVVFSVHKKTYWGQSIIIVGGHPALGNWDPKAAKETTWTDGDVWKGDIVLPSGSVVEYKYVLKTKEGLEWGPGQNKSLTVPSAVEAAVADQWDGSAGKVTVTIAITAATQVEEPASPVAPTPDEVVAAAIASEASVPVPEAPEFITAVSEVNGNGVGMAVNTIENLQLEELLPTPPPEHAASTSHANGNGVIISNNVVSAPPGMAAVSSAAAAALDEIKQYEEADSIKVVEVHGATATAAPPAVKPKQNVDSMTVAQLKTECKKRGLSSLGSRREIINRLEKAGW